MRNSYTMKELKNEVYKYVVEHKFASQNEIADDLNIDNGLDIMKVLSELHEDNYIIVKPLPLSINNSSSVRYVVTTKDYEW